MLSYEQWIESVGAEAAKVAIQDFGGGERGLFASRDIFMGERILYLPSRSLLSEKRIQIEGSRILENLEAGDTTEQDNVTKEQQISGMIEEFRRLIVGGGGDSEPSLVQMMTQTMQYTWRGDDAVALYLIACRKLLILEQRDEEPPLQQDVEDTPAAEPAEDAEPVLVQNVVAISEDFVIEEEGNRSSEPEGEILVTGAAIDEAADDLFPPFLPHVDMLPKEYPTNPLYFSEEELSRMEGTNCYEFSKRMQAQIESDWATLSAILRAYLVMDDRKVQMTATDDEDDDINSNLWDVNEDLELYKWALCTIYSRSTDFFVREGHRRVIAPLFDMMNHDFDSTVTHGMDAEGNLSVFAGSDIPTGSEIFLKYGSFPNEKLFLVYGFVVHPNPYDAVSIYAPIPPTDPLFARKAELLRQACGVLDPNTPYTLQLNEPIPESLLSALRLVGMQSPEELAASSSVGSCIGAASPENEYNALMALHEALHTMARRLALNLISDENLHAASGINPTLNQNTMRGTTSSTPVAPQPLLGVAEEVSVEENGETVTNPNILNCKILCQSEYLVLQSALAELYRRLELLENPEGTVTPQ